MSHFEAIKALYRNSFTEHGDSPASLLTPKGRNTTRFSAIDLYLNGKVSVCDYGCGLGYMYDYIQSKPGCTDVNYSGFDMLPEFIDKCKEKYTNVDFQVVGSNDLIGKNFDVVFSSGVFNMITDDDAEVSKKYAFERLKYLFHITGDVLICDFLSDFVDFKQSNSQHFSVQEIAEFCVKHLGRKFQIRHDLLPYEFTLIVHKNSNILRPDNVFEKP
jgi:cyclopropane fatty-acyl-phospholipid synthase-like methyltransferase